MFVGELIMSAREAFPDLPVQTLAAPSSGLAFAAFTSSSGILPTGTNYLGQVSFLLPWGETTAVAVSGLTLNAPNNALQLTVPNIPSGATAIKVYVQATNGQWMWMTFAVTAAIGQSQTVTFTGVNAVPGNIPTRNTAYLADSDGRAFGAYRLFGWLNDGLQLAGNIVGGGIPDMSGFNSVVGQPWYELIGNWKKLDGAWYQGYPVFFGRRQDVFRKNSVTGIVATLIVDYYADTVRVEVWPQPSVAGSSTTTTGAIGLTDSTIALTSSTVFQLPFGMCLIGTPANGEVISYASAAGNQLTGVMRGWGGTNAQSWPAGTPVYPFNGMISGLRIPTPYSVGQSLNTLRLPPGWAAGLSKYMMSRFRDAERKRAEAKDLMNEFTATMQNLRTTRQFAGPIQIQTSTGRGAEVYPGLGGPFGGVIVP